MATDFWIDPAQPDEALAVAGKKIRKATVARALQEFIGRSRQRELAELFGTLDWDEDFDYKGERVRRRDHDHHSVGCRDIAHA